MWLSSLLSILGGSNHGALLDILGGGKVKYTHENFQNGLRIQMAVRNVKGIDLSKGAGISPANVSQYLTGRNKGISFSTLTKICEFLKCSPNDLFQETPKGWKK
jgi:putative transcriptional regulator